MALEQLFCDDRVAGVFFPVDQVAGAGDAGRPVFPGLVGVGVVEGVVEAIALDDLVHGHGVLS